MKKAISNQTAGWTIEASSHENYNALSLANGRSGEEATPSRHLPRHWKSLEIRGLGF